MNIMKGPLGVIALLALLISSGVQATTERPQLKNYASYTDFLQAVVDYAKNDGAPPSPTPPERECKDEEMGPDGKPLNKNNPCAPKRITGEVRDGTSGSGDGVTTSGVNLDLDSLDNLDDLDDLDGSSLSTSSSSASGSKVDSANDSSNPSADTLEEAISLARDGLNPTYIDPASTRTTFRSFPMQPVEASDLASVTFIDALGGLLVDTRNSKIRLSIDPNTMINPLTLIDDRLGADALALNLDGFAFQQLLFNNVSPFFGGNFVWETGGNYYSIVNANPSFIDNNGIGLAFSTQARVRAAVVDSDGWISSANPNTPASGAFVIDPLNITTGTINANLWAIPSATGNTGIRVLLDTQSDIVVDLSNTQLGVASATRNGTGWDIGPANNFMAFGADSVLNIRLNGPLETVLSNPDTATNTPLVRINGSISRMSLGNIALLDGSSKEGIHIGRFTISNLAMVNTSVFFENDAIRVDLGKGVDNLHIAMERIVLGGSMSDLANGTLPPAIGDAEMRIKTPDNIQIILSAH